MMDNKAVIILGAHRSGTSALAAGIEAMGITLGRKTTYKNDENIKGFFENVDVVEFNEKFMRFLNTRWDNPLFCCDKALDSISEEKLQPWLESADAILKKICIKAKIWGVKDPRINMLLPFWIRVLKANGYDESNTYYIYTVRHPIEVAMSLQKRYRDHPKISALGRTLEQGCVLWLLYNYQSLRQLRGTKCIAVHYESLLSDPESQLERIARLVGVEFDKSKIEKYCHRFLDKRLKRQNISLINKKKLNIPPVVEDLYLNLNEWSKQPDFFGKEAHKAIDNYQNIKNALEIFESLSSIQPLTWFENESHIKAISREKSERKTLLIYQEELSSENTKLIEARDGLTSENTKLIEARDGLASEISETKKLSHALEFSNSSLRRENINLMTELVPFRNSRPHVLLKKLGIRINWLKFTIAKIFGVLKQPIGFDEKWYLENYQDVKNRNFDPYVHYLVWGWRKGWNPNNEFDVYSYLQNHSEVLWSGKEPYSVHLRDDISQ